MQRNARNPPALIRLPRGLIPLHIKLVMLVQGRQYLRIPLRLGTVAGCRTGAPAPLHFPAAPLASPLPAPATHLHPHSRPFPLHHVPSSPAPAGWMDPSAYGGCQWPLCRRRTPPRIPGGGPPGKVWLCERRAQGPAFLPACPTLLPCAAVERDSAGPCAVQRKGRRSRGAAGGPARCSGACSSRQGVSLCSWSRGLPPLERRRIRPGVLPPPSRPRTCVGRRLPLHPAPSSPRLRRAEVRSRVARCRMLARRPAGVALSARVLASLARCEQSQRIDPSVQSASSSSRLRGADAATLLIPSFVARLARREQRYGVNSTTILIFDDNTACWHVSACLSSGNPSQSMMQTQSGAGRLFLALPRPLRNDPREDWASTAVFSSSSRSRRRSSVCSSRSRRDQSTGTLVVSPRRQGADARHRQPCWHRNRD